VREIDIMDELFAWGSATELMKTKREQGKEVVLLRAERLIAKDNRPCVQGTGRAKPQPIVAAARNTHNMSRYYRPIPPELPRTTRILRATAL
jgi:hypothetical protein